MDFKIVPTDDGSPTIFLPGLNEHYHSMNGAITESIHVYIERGYLHHRGETITVFEVGFGTGLNALLTALSAEKTKRPTRFISAEKFPLDRAITRQLHYGNQIADGAEQLFRKIHESKWNETVTISPYFSLLKLKADITDKNFSFPPGCDVVYFDAFGPDKQPGMWTPAIFRKLYDATTGNGVFVTYSAKGEVRRQLASCGYSMERLPGPPGKFQMLRGIKKVANI